MNFERCRRRLRRDKGGVSEVVGNILILMITVVLFSAIVMYVNEIPVPEMTTKADFSASISFYDDPVSLTTRATLTITHAGGVSLNAINTAILLHIDAETDYTRLSEDGNFTHEYWSMGTDWTKDFAVASFSSEVVASVIDLDKKSTVWVSEVSGGAGHTPPIILQRYIDIDYVTATPDVIPDGDDFYFFVKVIDLDNDLSDVWVNSSGVPGAGGAIEDEYEDATATGWYRFDFIDVDDISAVDGAVIKIHAVDDLNHTTVSSYVISFINLPELPGTPTTGGGDNPDDAAEGYPPWLIYGSGGQGYTLFGENTTTERADLDDARSNFTKDEVVFVRVVSRYMHNIEGANSLQIMDTRNGFIYAPQYEGTFDSTVQRSTADRPFYFYSMYNQYSIYECQFSTVGLPPSNYALIINLASTGDRPYQFNPTVPMLLEETDSSITFTPAIWTYKYANETEEEWGLKTRPFQVSSFDSSVIYVRVEVQDAVDVPPPSVDDIRIMDLLGNTQLHGTPPAPPMIEPWEANTDDPTNHTYVFSVKLRINNGDQWLGGTHAYVLKIARFSDQNEGIYSLTKMIFIKASSAKAEWLVGAAGYMTGTSNFVDPQYLYHIQNNNFFTKKTVYDYSNAPSAADNYAVSALCLADIDGDGDKDILMGQYRSNSLYYIENSLTSYGSWQEASEITRPAADDDAVINCIAAGDINGDGDIDFAYSTLNEGSSDGRTIVIYNNTYGATGVLWSGSRYTNTLDGVRKIALEDMTGDGRADLIVLANGYVYVHDLTDPWVKSPCLATVPNTGSSNIQDFDIADVNRDGMLDILTAETSTGAGYSAIQGVRVNYYSNKTPTYRTLTGSAVPLAGMVVDGDLDDTNTEDGDSLIVRENTTSESTYIGQLDLRMQFNTLTSDFDQQLKVRAKVSAGATEGFYVWYSLVGSAGPYTPVMYIPSDTTDFEDFTVQLPSAVAGQALYIKVTDTISSNASASSVEYLYLDYVAILTDRHGGYTLNDKIASESLGYDCVRAANMNGCDTTTGDMGLEVAVAKDTGTHQWAVYNRTAMSTWSVLSGWTDTDANFYSRGSSMIDLHSSMNSDENYVKAILSKSSPRLFQVADVNGDGFSDIIVVNATVNPDITSQVAMFLNVYAGTDFPWQFYVIKDLAADFNTPDVTGGMTFLAVANLFTAESSTL